MVMPRASNDAGIDPRGQEAAHPRWSAAGQTGGGTAAPFGTVADWIVGGLGAATGGVGIVLGATGSREVYWKDADLRAMCPGNVCASEAEVEQYDGLRREALDARRRAIIGWSAASVAVACTGVYFIVRLSGNKGRDADSGGFQAIHVEAFARNANGSLTLLTRW